MHLPVDRIERLHNYTCVITKISVDKSPFYKKAVRTFLLTQGTAFPRKFEASVKKLIYTKKQKNGGDKAFIYTTGQCK